jgi:nucleoside-diphosphate-sugar epimerase
MSKALGELAISDWARETTGVAISLRFANVIGLGARGLVPYLVSHALKYPEGSVPAQCRGNGSVPRDYIPVTYAAKALVACLDIELAPGTHLAMNVGTGSPITNGWVAQVVCRVLRERGITLRIDFSNPLNCSESRQVVLKTDSLFRRTGLTPAPVEQIEGAIEDAVDALLADDRCRAEPLSQGGRELQV